MLRIAKSKAKLTARGDEKSTFEKGRPSLQSNGLVPALNLEGLGNITGSQTSRNHKPVPQSKTMNMMSHRDQPSNFFLDHDQQGPPQVLSHLDKIDSQHKQKVQMYKKLAMQQVSTLQQLNSQIAETVDPAQMEKLEKSVKELAQVKGQIVEKDEKIALLEEKMQLNQADTQKLTEEINELK